MADMANTSNHSETEGKVLEVDDWIAQVHSGESPTTVDMETVNCAFPASKPPQLSPQSFKSIWTLTTEFLAEVRAFASTRGTAFQDARKRLFRRVENSQVIAAALQHLNSSISSCAPQSAADIAQKRGQKKECHCPLCIGCFPYNKDLIAHMREVHGIRKSKSLMYKRIKQGRETIERLYL